MAVPSGIGTGAASGAVAGSALGPWGALAGGALGAGAGVANYFGGKSAEEAQQEALDRWRNRKTQLQNQLLASQFANVQRKQRDLSSYLGTMPTNGDVMPTHTAGAELDVTGAGAKLDPQLAAIYKAQAEHVSGIGDAQAVANSAAARRGRWMQALQTTGDNINAGGLAAGNDVVRDREGIAQDLARNDAEYSNQSVPNSAYNLQLLGSLLGAGSNAGIQIAGRPGAPAPAAPPRYTTV